MSTIPQDHRSQPQQSATEAPAAGAVPAGDAGPQPAAHVATPTEGTPRTAPSGDQPRRRRRRRRRHGQPHLDAAATALAESPATPQNAPAQAAAADASSPITTEQATPAQLPTGTAPRKRRRRRRRPKPEGTGPAAATSEPISGAPGDVVQVSAAAEAREPRRDRAPRHRERGQPTPREERSRDRENRRERSSAPHGSEGRDARARDARGPRDKRGPRTRKERRPERDRNALAKKPEAKLYRLETTVDRGFEDVPDSANEGATRRVEWTILKRTTADQRTARAISAIYVLRRDGTDTEFAHLSEARAAVHKTINHPEKLTLSKTDHAAARGTKK